MFQLVCLVKLVIVASSSSNQCRSIIRFVFVVFFYFKKMQFLFLNKKLFLLGVAATLTQVSNNTTIKIKIKTNDFLSIAGVYSSSRFSATTTNCDVARFVHSFNHHSLHHLLLSQGK